MTDTTTAQRYQKKSQSPLSDGSPRAETEIAHLRSEAKALGVNSFGLGKEQLRVAIQEAHQDAKRAQKDDAPRIDATGEALGPAQIKRIPLGARAPRLAADQRPGYSRRWINDHNDRIERSRRGGYEHVRDANGEPMSRPVGSAEGGGGMRAYLMEIPQHLYDEDFAAGQGVVDDIDRAIYRGKYKEEPGDQRYVPEGGISMTVSRGRR